MRLALAIALSMPTALYAQPAPDSSAPPTEPAPPTPQPNPAGKPAKTIGIEAALIAPLADYADDAQFGVGALVRYVIPRSDVLALTLRAGGLFHVAAGNRDTLLLFPALFGLQIALSDRWSAVADAGISLRYQGSEEITVTTAFGFCYRRKRLRLAAEILVPDLSVVDSTAGLFGSIGFAR